MGEKKKVIIMGGGPAGITAAYELLKQSDEYVPIVLEELKQVGGISKTLEYKEHRMDIGGHRFFSKDQRVMKWWTDLMPLQGEESKDDIILDNHKPLAQGGPNPEKEDGVMLIRQRVSRILYLRKFFDYPISMKPSTFINMGFMRTMKAGFGYLGARFKKRPENSLEDFMINRFGKTLYGMFFEDYTEKLWGRHPSQIDASWGAQRIKGLSLSKAILNAVVSVLPKKKTEDLSQTSKETSLIEQFIYPKYGPGQLWETAAREVEKMGGSVLLGAKVVEVNTQNGQIKSVVIDREDGEREVVEGDIFISSLAIKDLVAYIRGEEVPKNVYEIATNLPYRDFMTVGLLVKKLNLENKTHIKTVSNIVPDTWIYVQERDVKVGRLQIFNNWSPYLVKDVEHTVWMGLEYFCDEGDQYWKMSDEAFIRFAKDEMIKLNLLKEEDILDSVRERVKKAYPAYFGTYTQFDEVKTYLDGFENLYCIGRNGQHRYNNMDHSMMTAFETVSNILMGRKDKANIWSVNTEESYHEVKEDEMVSEEKVQIA